MWCFLFLLSTVFPPRKAFVWEAHPGLGEGGARGASTPPDFVKTMPGNLPDVHVADGFTLPLIGATLRGSFGGS